MYTTITGAVPGIMMNKLLFATFTFAVALMLGGCPDTSVSPPTPPPTSGRPTAIGVSVGALTQSRIGAAGGRVVSSDNIVTLDIPAGALSAETTISIEPLTNTAPGGIGRAYRLLPSGLTFALSATLTIGYGNANIAPSSAAIAFQGSDNIWQGLVAVSQTDAGRHSVTATISHFTDFAIFQRWYIAPDTTSVETGATVSFLVYTTDLPDIGAATIQSPLPDPYTIQSADVKTWAVNNISGGNSTVGTIAPGGNRSTATYTAPRIVPDENPVEVEATVDRSGEGKPDVVVTASVTITSPAGAGDSRWEMEWEYVDTTACPTDPISGDFHRALVWRGTDTIIIASESGSGYYVKEAMGTLKSIEVRGLGKCPDPPYTAWSEIEVMQQPAITSSELSVGARLEPFPTVQVPTPTPTQLVVNTGGVYQSGLAIHRTLGAGSSDHHESLGEGFFQFDARFRWPLRDPDVFDSTWSMEQGGQHTWRVHATLRRLK